MEIFSEADDVYNRLANRLEVEVGSMFNDIYGLKTKKKVKYLLSSVTVVQSRVKS